MELSQSSTHVYKLLSVSGGMLETSEFLCPQVFRSVTSCPFEAYVVLRTILASIFFGNFYNAFFQRRLVHNDDVDCLPKFVSALRTSEFSVLLCAQFVNEFDNSPPSISLYL